jgi:anti-sigma regulatory factor (Ser/Thr protein kinase)
MGSSRAPGTETWEYRGTASPQVLRSVRRRLGSFVRKCGGPPADEVVLASWEAMGNVFHHAYHGYTGPIEVSASVQDGVLVVTISDDGQWEAPGVTGAGGRGFTLIHKLADGVNLTSTEEGTTVTLTWPLH